MKRVLEFDGIRAAAILFILLCHICFGMGWTAMGRFCANTFNTVFFLLSALLLGLNVNEYKIGGGRYVFQFLSKRVTRLLCSLWPMQIVFAVVFYLAGIFANIFCGKYADGGLVFQTARAGAPVVRNYDNGLLCDICNNRLQTRGI